MKEGDANRCLLLCGWSQRTTLLRADSAVTLSPFIAIIHDEKPINSPTGGRQVLADGGLPSP